MFGFWLLFMIWTAKAFYGVSWVSASVKILGAFTDSSYWCNTQRPRIRVS